MKEFFQKIMNSELMKRFDRIAEPLFHIKRRNRIIILSVISGVTVLLVAGILLSRSAAAGHGCSARGLSEGAWSARRPWYGRGR